jgi:hypothetical protein
MQRKFLRALSALAWCLTCMMTAMGCGSRVGSMDRFVPSSNSAREALEAALTAWQNGEQPGAIRSSPTVVQVVDTHRGPDRPLQTFEILGEVGSDSGRCFSVRITLENPNEEQKVRFVIVGINPLWVFREEDYTMLSHWEHPMPESPAAQAEKEVYSDRF